MHDLAVGLGRRGGSWQSVHELAVHAFSCQLPGRGRPPLPVGVHGRIDYHHARSGRVRARARFRDADGVARSVARRGAQPARWAEPAACRWRRRSSPGSAGDADRSGRSQRRARWYRRRSQNCLPTGRSAGEQFVDRSETSARPLSPIPNDAGSRRLAATRVDTVMDSSSSKARSTWSSASVSTRKKDRPPIRSPGRRWAHAIAAGPGCRPRPVRPC
jgi:hypothetical protein